MTTGTLSILLSISMLILTACASGPKVVSHNEPTDSKKPNLTYVVSHGWHTGLVIPAEKVYAHLPTLRSRFGNTAHIEFGWGDKGFYQANEITSGLTLRAIFWPTQSVIHAVAIPEDVHQYFPDSQIQTLCASDSQINSLMHYIANSFRKTKNDAIIPLKQGIYGDSQFYQAIGDYYLMNTCNTWTAKALKSMGHKLSTTFKLTAGSVMNALPEQQGIHSTQCQALSASMAY